MDTRICFRVRERKDVDLVLGQGMLGAGWHAHTLNAPGKFLVSAPEHTTPKRARAYLVTDDDVARTVARYGWDRPQLDSISRGALGHSPAPPSPSRGTWSTPSATLASPKTPRTTTTRPRKKTRSGVALCDAPDEGADIAELMRASGMTRPTLYRHLAAHADAGPGGPGQPRPVARGQGRGRGRAMNVCLTNLSRLTPRACLHVKARTQTMRQTNETSYPQLYPPLACSRTASNV